MDEGNVHEPGAELLRVFQQGRQLAERLLGENEQLRQHTGGLGRELATRQEELRALREQEQTLLARQQELEGQHNDLVARRGELEARVSLLEASSAETVRRFEIERAARARELNALQEGLEAARREAEAERHEWELRQGEVDSLRRELAVAQAELAASRRELEAAQAEFAPVEQELAGARTELARLRGEVEAAQAELDRRNAAVLAGEDALAQARAALAEAASHGADLARRADEQEQRAQELEQQARELERRLAETEDYQARLAAELEPLRGGQDRFEFERRQSTAETERLQTALMDSERKNDGLANLYLAAFALHRSLEWTDVIQALDEILLNQVGAAGYAVGLATESNALEVVASRGLNLERLSLEGAIAEAFVSGAAFYAGPGAAADGPLAVVPLATQESTVGVLAVYRLLPQKPALTSNDQELLALLSRLAATALVAARLNAQARNGRSVLRNFLTRFRAHGREQTSPGG